MERPQKWLSAIMKWDPSKQVEAVEITNDVHSQIAMDMDRTNSSMLFGHVSTEEKVSKRRIQVTDLLIQWLQCQRDLHAGHELGDGNMSSGAAR